MNQVYQTLFSRLSSMLFFRVLLIGFIALLSVGAAAQIPISDADFQTNNNALSEADFTNTSIWEYYNGTSWVAANKYPDSTNNVFIRAKHLLNLINGTTIKIKSGKTITVFGTLTLGTGKIKGTGTVSVESGGTLNFGSKNYPADAVTDNIAVTGGILIKTGSTSIFSGLTAKSIDPRTFGNVIFRTKKITLTGDISIAKTDTMTVIDSSSVTANGNIIVDSAGYVEVYGTFSIIDKQITGPSGPQIVAVKNGGIFNCSNPDGFSGGNGTATRLTSVNSNIETLSLNTGSTVRYNAHAGTQYITTKTDYKTLVMADTAIKLLRGNSKFATNLTLNAGTTLTCLTYTLTGTDSSAIANIRGIFKSGSANTTGAIKGSIPVASVSLGSTAIVELNGVGVIQYIDGRSYPRLILNNANSSVLAGDATMNGDLLINASNKLDISDKTLTINSTMSGTGTLSGSVSADLNVNFPNTLNFTPGFNLLNNLTVNVSGSVTLGNDLGIAGVLTPGAGTLNLNNKIVTLKAGTNNQTLFPNTKTYPNTGMIGKVTGTINYGTSGIFVVERFVPELRRYRLFSPSVTAAGTIRDNWQEGGSVVTGYGTHITGSGGAANGFDPTITNNPSLFLFDNLAQTWNAAANTTTAGVLKAGSAWRLFVRGDRTVNLNDPTNNPPATPAILRTTGKILTGDVVYNTTGNFSTPKLNATNMAYSLVGNPYASAVNWDSVVKYDLVLGVPAGAMSDLRQDYTIIDPNLSNGTNGVSVNYNAATKTCSNPSSKISANIQPGQAFFVQTVSAALNPSPLPSITFKEANKTSAFTKVFRTESEMARLWIQLLLSTADIDTHNIADGVAAVFNDAFSPEVKNEDSYKLNNSSDNLAINRNGTLLSIEGRPALSSNDTLSLSLYRLKQKSYYLKLFSENFSTDAEAFIKDSYLHNETPVNLIDTALFAFSIDADSASFAPDRFSIVFKNSNVLPLSITNVKAYRKEQHIQVDWEAFSDKEIKKFEIEKSLNGLEFYIAGEVPAKNISALSQRYSWLDTDARDGNNFYRIKAIEKSGLLKLSRVVVCKISNANSSISINPNPVRNGVINLRVNNADRGKYQVSISNSLGQKVYSGTIESDGRTNRFVIDLKDKSLTKGMYHLSLLNENLSLTGEFIAE